MPIVPIKFKSDKEIEKELKPIEVKVRRFSGDPLDFLEKVPCLECSKYIEPECKLGVPYSKDNAFYGCYPCVRDCPIVVHEKKVGDLCDHYVSAKCKDGYYVSLLPTACPGYDGPEIPKTTWEIFTLKKDEKLSKADESKPENK